MKNTLQQVFHSGKFVVGFSIFMFIVLTTIIFPLIINTPPLGIISQGTFLPPGIYVNIFDSFTTPPYTLNLDDAATKRIASRLNEEDRIAIKEWLVKAGIPENQIDITDTTSLLNFWTSNYDPTVQIPGMTFAKTRYYQRLNDSLEGILSTEGIAISSSGTFTDTTKIGTIAANNYVNVREIPNVLVVPFGTNKYGDHLRPGLYMSVYDSFSTTPYILLMDEAATKRIDSKLSDEDRLAIKAWLVAAGIPENQVDTNDTASLLGLWTKNYDPNKVLGGSIDAEASYYQVLDGWLRGLLTSDGMANAYTGTITDTQQTTFTVAQTDYVNVRDVINVRPLLLGTDNFGRDVLPELVSATGTSLLIGLVAGLIATMIGLVMGLIAGYKGGVADDIIVFFTNIFTVIPTFVLLILISFSIGQEKRGPVTIAIVIGLTAWPWTARAVRAQVMSLRNRDHVNLSKLSGHPLALIIFADILPYIASYVFMALILQISTAILAEASLSILGLGPKTTVSATLGLMMNWAFIYMAPSLGKWWAYMPVIVVIALISFSLNLMNTGLDQVYNPALRE